MSNNGLNVPVVLGEPIVENDDEELNIIDRIPMIEVDEISPVGWFCLIFGCFFCPGFNLLGLCMTERHLVPAYDVAYIY